MELGATLQNLPTLMVAALALMGSPGPATIGAAGTSAAFGLRRALPYVLGSATGTVIVLAVLVAGVGSLPAFHLRLGPVGVGTVARLVCVAYLLWLSWRIATAPASRADADRSRSPGFPSGLALGSTNPKAYLALGALVGSHGVTDEGLAGAVLVLAVLGLLVVVVHLAWAVLGATAARSLRRPGIARTVNVALAVVLAASTVPLL